MLLDSGATSGSASMIPESTAPPKQKSMELNQQANGLTRDTSKAPGQQDTRTLVLRRFHVQMSSFCTGKIRFKLILHPDN